MTLRMDDEERGPLLPPTDSTAARRPGHGDGAAVGGGVGKPPRSGVGGGGGGSLGTDTPGGGGAFSPAPSMSSGAGRSFPAGGLLPTWAVALMAVAPRVASAARPPGAVMPGVSLIAACSSRQDVLSRVLPGWARVAGVDEVVLVDWSAQPPLSSVVTAASTDWAGEGVSSALNSSPAVTPTTAPVRVLRVVGETSWQLTRAYNLAAAAARYATLLRVDCDHALSPSFLSTHPLRTGAYYAGNYMVSRNDNELHLNGAAVVARSDFWAVGGYDERIQAYGYDDEDLYTRLDGRGLARLNLSYDVMQHVAHGNEGRSARPFPRARIDYHALLLEGLPRWGDTANASSPPHATYALRHVEAGADRGGCLERSSSGVVSPPSPTTAAVVTAVFTPLSVEAASPPDARSTAWDTAIGRRLWGDYDLPWDFFSAQPRGVRERLLRRLNARTAAVAAAVAGGDSRGLPRVRLLVVHAAYGLGNRLRALGSAAAYAAATGRELVVVWVPDVHLGARLGDLFAVGDDGGGGVVNGSAPPDEAVMAAAEAAGGEGFTLFTSWGLSWPLADYAPWDVVWSTWRFYNYMVEGGPDGGKDVPIDIPPTVHLYWQSAYVMVTDVGLTNWTAANVALQSLPPHPTVASLVAGVATRINMTRLGGAHVRCLNLTADIPEITNTTAEYGVEGAAALSHWRAKASPASFGREVVTRLRGAATTLDGFYVASDWGGSANVIRAAVAAASPPLVVRGEGAPAIVTLPPDATAGCEGDRGGECVRAALADALLLARTPVFLGSTWSSFTELVMRLGGVKAELAGSDWGDIDPQR
ncbi:hypothetical protein MMPV_009114 [Pyropia vietnamensis]